MIDEYYLKILKENIGDIWLENYVWNDVKMNENLFDDIDLRYLQIINNFKIKNNNLKSN
jgi:hypothetical protein